MKKEAPDWLGCGKAITQESWDGFLAARDAYYAQKDCVLFSIVQISSVHQYTVPLFYGTRLECEAERLKRNFPDSLKVARVEDLPKYSS